MPPRKPFPLPARRLADLFSTALLLGLFFQLTTRGFAETIFQLGTFDESSAEFSPINDPVTGQRRINYADPTQDPVFVVGRSDPARHWFALQPGNANGATGSREHPFTIEFQLDQTSPSNRFRLNLALLAYSTRLPALRITVNNASGWLYQRPVLAYTGGDPAVFFLPHYSTSKLVCDIPGHLFRNGTNRITLTPVDDPGDRDDVRPSGYPWPGNSAVVHDAISLERMEPPSSNESPGTKLTAIEPTCFFFNRGPGNKLVQEVVVYLTDAPRQAEVNLILPSGPISQQLSNPNAFGESRLVFLVPEISTACNGRLEINSPSGRQEIPVTLMPRRKWEILVVANEHLDIGYTDYDSKVAELQSRTIDTALELFRKHPDFRFSLDGYWVAEQFLRGRTPGQVRAMQDAVRKGQIGIPAVYGSAFTGFAGLENLIRALYPSKRLLDRFDVPMNFALITDVPSYSWSWASVLAAAEIPYLVAASDAYRGPFLLHNRFNETSPHRWEGPDGGRVITWYSRHYHQVASLFGMPPVLAQGRESLPRFLQAYEHPGYPADTVLLYGTQVENTDLDPAQATFVKEWNSRFAHPRLRHATFGEAMKLISDKSKSALPVHRGDGGPYWEDGLGANAKITSLARQNIQRVLSAEKFSTLASILNPTYAPDKTAIEGIWRNLLLTDEHTWHADQSVREPTSQQSQKQGEIKDSRSIRARQDLEHLLGRSLSAIAEKTRSPHGTLLVFNSLSWARGGIIELDLPKGRILKDAATGSRLGQQLLHTGNGIQHVRVWVPDVPALGFRLLRIEPGIIDQAKPGADSFAGILENRFYQIGLDAGSGRIRSIRDKESGRDLIDHFRLDAGFNRYLYVTGADELPNRLVQYSSVSPLPALRIHPAVGGRLVSIQTNDFSTSARIESSSLNTPGISTEIVLYNDRKRIDFINRVEKMEVLTREAAYFEFALNLKSPTFRYATQNGHVDPSRDLLPGAGMEWFTTQGWINASDESLSVTLVPLDAPLFTLGGIARGEWPRSWVPREPRILSYVMNNYTPEGYQAGQGGTFIFRHSLTSRTAFDATDASRFAAEVMTPLEVNEISRGDKSAGDRGIYVDPVLSGISIHPPDVTLVNWKLAEDGDGTILRFVENAGKTARVRVQSDLWKARSATLCNAVEDNRQSLKTANGAFEFETRPFGITTIRLRMK